MHFAQSTLTEIHKTVKMHFASFSWEHSLYLVDIVMQFDTSENIWGECNVGVTAPRPNILLNQLLECPVVVSVTGAIKPIPQHRWQSAGLPVPRRNRRLRPRWQRNALRLVATEDLARYLSGMCFFWTRHTTAIADRRFKLTAVCSVDISLNLRYQ